MKIRKLETHYTLIDMDDDDLRSLLSMIKSACLPDRGNWNNVKQQIEKLLDTQ